MPKILIVDDDRILADVLAMALRSASFDVTVVYDGQRALTVVKQDSFDAIILDVMMPQIDGYEVCRRLRADAKTQSVPVLMLTALTMPMERREAMRAGADLYLTKPVVISTVIDRLRAVLDLERKDELRPIIAFVGAKGGVGTSTVALNTATSLANEGRRVLLMEVGGTGATCAWTMGLRPESTVLDLAASKRYPFDVPNLQRYLINCTGGLSYLPILHDGQIAMPDATGRVLSTVLRLLHDSYEVIILDVGPAANAMWKTVFTRSLSVVPVTTQDSISRRHLQTLLNVLGGERSMTKVIGLVLIQQATTAAENTVEELAEETKLTVLGNIPAAPVRMLQANAIPKPLVQAYPKAEASRALVRLGQRLVGE